MLYELDPSTEITGGAWYTDQEYDLEFIEALSTQCYKYIYSKVKQMTIFMAIELSH
jgi:DNA-directed RNA polymerase III subunit RPC6